MNKEQIGFYGYVLDLQKDVLVLTSDNRVSALDVMILMMKHDALGCRVYETNNSECMTEWKLVTTYGELTSSFSH